MDWINDHILAWAALIGSLASFAVVIPTLIKLARSLKKAEQRTLDYFDARIGALNGRTVSIIQSFPGPAWLKVAVQNDETGDLEFIMHEINEHYESVFGIPRRRYLGNTDREAGWPQEEHDRFYQHDLKVWSTGVPETFMETIDGVELWFNKIRLLGEDGKVKGIMGYQVSGPQGQPLSAESAAKAVKEI